MRPIGGYCALGRYLDTVGGGAGGDWCGSSDTFCVPASPVRFGREFPAHCGRPNEWVTGRLSVLAVGLYSSVARSESQRSGDHSARQTACRYTTYTAVPHYVTSRNRSVFLDTTT